MMKSHYLNFLLLINLACTHQRIDNVQAGFIIGLEEVQVDFSNTFLSSNVGFISCQSLNKEKLLIFNQFNWKLETIDFESFLVEEVIQLEQDGPSSVFYPVHILDSEEFWLFFDQFNFARINKLTFEAERWNLRKSKNQNLEIGLSDLEYLKGLNTLNTISDVGGRRRNKIFLWTEDIRNGKWRFLQFDPDNVVLEELPSPWEINLIEDHTIQVDHGRAKIRNQALPSILPIQNKFVTTYNFKNQIDIYDQDSGNQIFKRFFQSKMYENEKEKPRRNQNGVGKESDKEDIFDWNLDVEFGQLYYQKEIDKYIRLVRSKTEGSIKNGFKVFLSIYDSKMKIEGEISLSEMEGDLSFEHYFVNQNLYIKASTNEAEDKMKFYKLKFMNE
ncbi:hypothetical protein SAMN06295967_101190 [Belliella buryatensis]|uniref:TolB-like 6-blade propeller-like n=1 Tax=Belliella buryatensis TaxID=1500549 RepID=A0A239AJ24_9BACT|nr:hypothetical protein [Belliella buryatensis]SNR95550.1 hypothetical protein SAMN06295967_101190 [Belliella buryatensis]